MQYTLCTGYNDYEKAIDSIEHEAILKVSRTIGLNITSVVVLEHIYTTATARVHMANQVSEKIPNLGGVRQGDQNSPKVFTATIQKVFKMPNCNIKE